MQKNNKIKGIGKETIMEPTRDGGVRVELYYNGAFVYTKRCDNVQAANYAASRFWSNPAYNRR